MSDELFVGFTLEQALTAMSENDAVHNMTEAQLARMRPGVETEESLFLSVAVPDFPFIYEGWREGGRLINSPGAEPNVISPMWEENVNLRRFDWDPRGLTHDEMLDSLTAVCPGLLWRVHGGTGIVIFIERPLDRNPAWPLNRPLGEHADRALTLNEATALLRDEVGLVAFNARATAETQGGEITVWDPVKYGSDATARDLLCEIFNAVRPAGHWKSAAVHTGRFDPAYPEESLRGVEDIPWIFQSGTGF
ncbi:hypothetical protein JXA47_14960 [Candidatus Sumerlaeota bacterium]|nr:hypothetical protein [Candidatus Sumerlaeota bacterium]